mgnify:CR=1 FL=1
MSSFVHLAEAYPARADDPYSSFMPENFDAIREKYRKKFEADYLHFVKKLTIPDAEIIEEDE